MTEPVKGDEDSGAKFLEAVARNCRVLYKRVAKETGLSYQAVKTRVERAVRRGMLSIKPLIIAKSFGRVGAVLRIKSSGNREKIIEILSKCNRVLGLITVNEEIIAVFIAREKSEVISLINGLSLVGDGLVEYSVEYGEIPPNLLIPVKYTGDCEQKCPLAFTGKQCIPELNLKNNKH